MVLLEAWRGEWVDMESGFFFKQKTAYEMRISDWSSDVCSSDPHLLEEAKEGLSASKAFGPALKKMTDATTAKDAAALQAALTEGQATATTPDDKYLAAFYQLQLGKLGRAHV